MWVDFASEYPVKCQQIFGDNKEVVEIGSVNDRNKTVCFAGHREVYQRGVDEKVKSLILKLAQQGATIFLTGGMGEFDRMCNGAVRAVKREFPSIRLCLIIPYLTQTINEQKDYLLESYDELIFPDRIEGVHYKSAITLRNRWMTENSEIMLAYVGHEFGGAYQMMKYAQIHGGIRIINLYKK